MKTWKRISSGQFASVSFNIFHFILWILKLKLGRYIIKPYVLTMYQFQPFFHQLFMNDILSDHNQYHYQRIGNLRYSREFSFKDSWLSGNKTTTVKSGKHILCQIINAIIKTLHITRWGKQVCSSVVRQIVYHKSKSYNPEYFHSQSAISSLSRYPLEWAHVMWIRPRNLIRAGYTVSKLLLRTNEDLFFIITLIQIPTFR